MMRCRQRSLQNHQQPRRRGAMFAYVMAYLTLSMMLLGLTGSTLHLLFRANQTNRQMFQHLARIRDVEQQLREDTRQADHIQFTDQELVVSRNSDTVTWRLSDNKAVREVRQDQERQALMSIPFRRGTQLTFARQSASLFALRITPPAVASANELSKESTGPTARLPVVEILLAQFAPGVSTTR